MGSTLCCCRVHSLGKGKLIFLINRDGSNHYWKSHLKPFTSLATYPLKIFLGMPRIEPESAGWEASHLRSKELCSPPFLARLVSVIIWLSTTSDLSLVGGLSQNNHLQEIKEPFFQKFSLPYYCYPYYQDTLSNLFSIAFLWRFPSSQSQKDNFLGEKNLLFLSFLLFSKKSWE